MKIHIIGGPGSGKSFIARKLAERYDLPVLDLDEIFWDHRTEHYGFKADPETRDAALKNFIIQDGWIVEGAYHRWLAPGFHAADWVFMLTPPLWRRQVRIVRRFCRRKLGLESGKKETLQSFIQLLAWSRKYDEDNLMRAEAMLQELGLSAVRCNCLGDVLIYLGQAGNATEGGGKSAAGCG